MGRNRSRSTPFGITWLRGRTPGGSARSISTDFVIVAAAARPSCLNTAASIRLRRVSEPSSVRVARMSSPQKETTSGALHCMRATTPEWP